MFPFKDKKSGEEREMSVAEYFTKHVGVRLEFPALQCITVCFYRSIVTLSHLVLAHTLQAVYVAARLVWRCLLWHRDDM